MQSYRVILLIFLLSVGGNALAVELFYAVKLTDMKGNNTYAVMSKQELTDTEEQIRTETRFFSKAQAVIAKEWSENEANKGIQYPGNQLMPRKTQILMTSRSRDEADKKRVILEDSESRALDKKKEAEEKKQKSAKTDAEKKKVERQKQREQKREGQIEDACRMLQSKLDELISSAKDDTKKSAEKSEKK